MAHVISIANQKGGVGKTTTTFNLSSALNARGYKVAMIDNDPQGNLSSYATHEIPQEQITIDEVYLAKRPLELTTTQLLEVREGLYLLPSSELLSGVELYLMAKAEREMVLKKALGELRKHFDFILIDNPPTMNLLTLNGLVASDQVLVPMHADYFSMEGLAQILSSVDNLKKWNVTTQLLGVFTSLYDDRKKLNREVWSSLKEELGDLLLEVKISNSVKVAESAGFAKSVLEYAPRSQAAEDFRNLAIEVEKRCLHTN